MAFRMRFRKGVSPMAIAKSIIVAVLGLYIGGFILTQVGSVMECTCSPFYKGLSLIGWTTQDNSTTSVTGCTSAELTSNSCLSSKYVLESTANAGILTIVGLIVMAAIVIKFIQVQW